jgi:TRAP-type C4-dicarboxylate transport system substrate-binding protein
MVKKGFLIFLVLGLVFTIAACGGSTTTTTPTKDNNQGTKTEAENSTQETKPAPEKVITLKVADFFPTTHYLSVQGSVFFIKKAEELTGGKVKFDYYPTEQLAAARDLFDATKSNITDIGQIQVGYVADKIPLSGVAEIPGSFNNTVEGAKAYWELIDKVLYEQEFKKNNIRPLFNVVLPAYQLLTKDVPIHTVDDIKGLKIRAGGGAQSLLSTALGGVPVAMSGHEVYSSLQRDVIDSVLFPLTSVQNYSLQELTKYSTINVNLGSTAHVWGINENVWDTLPKDIQEALLEAGQATLLHLAEYQEKSISKAIEELKAQGVEFIELDDEQLKLIQNSIDVVWVDWVKKLEERGLPATKVKETFLEAVKALRK